MTERERSTGPSAVAARRATTTAHTGRTDSPAGTGAAEQRQDAPLREPAVTAAVGGQSGLAGERALQLQGCMDRGTQRQSWVLANTESSRDLMLDKWQVRNLKLASQELQKSSASQYHSCPDPSHKHLIFIHKGKRPRLS